MYRQHPAIVEYVAQQLDLPLEVVHKYQWEGRRFKELTHIHHELDMAILAAFVWLHTLIAE